VSLLCCFHNSFVFQAAIQKFKYKVYRTIILPVVLYGCEIWSLTWRKECRLRVFENRVLRREENIWAKEGGGNRGLEKST